MLVPEPYVGIFYRHVDLEPRNLLADAKFLHLVFGLDLNDLRILLHVFDSHVFFVLCFSQFVSVYAIRNDVHS